MARLNVTLQNADDSLWYAGCFSSQEDVDAWVAEAKLDSSIHVLVEVEPEASIESNIQAKKEALKLLASTDWLVIRQADNGVPVPQEIKDQRAQARLTLNQ